GCLYVDQLKVFDKKKNKSIKDIYKFSKELKKENYDYVIDLHAKLRPRLISFFLGVKTFRYKKRPLMKTLLAKFYIIKALVRPTTVRKYFGAFKKWNLKYTGEEDLNFAYESKDLESMKEFVGLPVFGIGASHESKKWSAEKYAELAKRIYEKDKSKILIIGDSKDSLLAEKIIELSGDICINLCNKTTLKESGALLSKAKYLVSSDSSMFHIGRAVGCMTIGLFGPTDPKAVELGENSFAIFLEEKCSPCTYAAVKNCHKKHNNCMKNISVQKVYEIISKKF
ncbi:MAG: glycosyltransferase family 9 protein, partial [Fusobacteriaceae bacterium]